MKYKIPFSFCSCLLFLFLLTSCTQQIPVLEQLESMPDPKIAIAAPNENALISEKSFTGMEKEHGNISIVFLKAKEPEECYSLLKTYAEDETVTALGCELTESNQANALVSLASQHQKPIIFWGESPTDTVLDSYDRCWYVGVRSEEACELMGQIAADSLKSGLFTDRNQNRLVDFSIVEHGALLKSDEAYHNIIRVMEHNGYFSHFISADSPAKEPAVSSSQDTAVSEEVSVEIQHSGEEMSNALSSHPPLSLAENILVLHEQNDPIELFLCPTAKDAIKTVLALEQIAPIKYPPVKAEADSVYEEESEAESNENTKHAPSPLLQWGIICGEHNQQSRSLLNRGVLLGYVSYNEREAADVILTLAENTSLRAVPSTELRYIIEDHRRIFIPHTAETLLHTAKKEP